MSVRLVCLCVCKLALLSVVLWPADTFAREVTGFSRVSTTTVASWSSNDTHTSCPNREGLPSQLPARDINVPYQLNNAERCTQAFHSSLSTTSLAERRIVEERQQWRDGYERAFAVLVLLLVLSPVVDWAFRVRRKHGHLAQNFLLQRAESRHFTREAHVLYYSHLSLKQWWLLIGPELAFMSLFAASLAVLATYILRRQTGVAYSILFAFTAVACMYAAFNWPCWFPRMASTGVGVCVYVVSACDGVVPSFGLIIDSRATLVCP